ncbi:MAG TPA: hypothetical protein PLP42_22585, partial [Acidobacteriota bacterium]|nr:hypothetical protein [Acidobacteriota bacterium]
MKLKIARWWPKDLRGRLTILVLVALIPMLITQAVVFGYWYGTQRNTVLQSNLELARTFGALYERYLTDLANAEQTMGEALLRLDSDSATALLTSRAADYPGIFSFSWASPEGVILLSSRQGARGISVADRDYFKQLQAGREWAVSDLLRIKVGGDPGLVLAQAIKSETRILGVVLGEIVPERLGETLTT